MAFTFQINRDVKFNHNEALLKKAEENHPEIFKTKAAPKRIVEIIPDETKLNGWGVKEAALSLENLSSFGMKRDDSLILDFGEHCVGSFSVNISSVGSPMDAPLYMRVRFGEIPAELAGNFSSYEGWLSKSWIQEEYIHLDELPAKLSLPRRYSFRYVEIKVLDTSPKWQAVFENPEVVKETSADYRNLKEIFVEEELKKIYDVSVKTLAECMQDVFEDGPKRDRRLWIGDLRLQTLANYFTFDNVELVKRCLYLFGAMNTAEGKIPANVFVKPASLPDDTFLFDYSLFFISVLYDYETAHPDIEFLKELFPVKGIATPYMYHHVTEALFEAGLQEEAIRLLKSYWGEMLRLGADTFWEAFEPENPDYSPYGNPIVSSYCHAWSCTPVYLIHKYLL
ncbi:MAG: cellobiose phosphorylase [Clostridiales bacterium]|nr:cellobiose phosphorylase [Clostridiales bacterium]